MKKTSPFEKHRDTLETHETMMGTARGRLAVALDLLTDSLALVGQHGVYCRSERFPGQPRMDVADAVVADPARREMFLRDARAAAAVSHPNIVTLYEVGEDDEGVYLVHEFIQGQTLKNVIAGRPLNPRRAVDLAN